ncbi:RISC-loading complex subunit tarbp2-like isoform X2 [Wyeomyia smithii]|nr:RISC-loading complex subunit tarbp2-like isoform X2 [Wyeomyia smithii]XP_055548284.1 RISC-loading complex subunit tarbp2-like isoform X2 [Wyeomyia smithii]
MCMAHRWPMPIYETEMEVGFPHQCQFTIACAVLKYREVGKGSSKKIAKTQAAQKMWQRLQDQPLRSRDTPQVLNGEGNEEDENHQTARAVTDKFSRISLSDHPSGGLSVKTEQIGDGEDEPTGNPIGWLQEMCMARRWPPPTYETEMEVGLPHERQFTIACAVLTNRELGKGNSKKIAKRRAAQRMWQTLQDQALKLSKTVHVLDEEGNEKEEKHAASKTQIDKLSSVSLGDPPARRSSVKVEQIDESKYEPTGNPIGWLQEMCVARRWPPPIYETEMEGGLPHQRQFAIVCAVSKYREVGRGNSKKIAKHQAAQRMWQRLQVQPLEPRVTAQVLDDERKEELSQMPEAECHDTGTTAEIQSGAARI